MQLQHYDQAMLHAANLRCTGSAPHQQHAMPMYIVVVLVDFVQLGILAIQLNGSVGCCLLGLRSDLQLETTAEFSCTLGVKMSACRRFWSNCSTRTALSKYTTGICTHGSPQKPIPL
jgi:hypothetical protein